MKKLMIAATAAAMASGAFATLQPEVYEMTLTIKTTACKIAKTKNLCDENIVDSYRVKATQTLKGLFWGCDCPTIAEPKAFETFDDFGTSDASHGYVFWNKKDGTPFQTAEFGWELFHYIDPKFSSVEGTWDLVMTDKDDNVVVDLRGAGFGQAHYSAKAEEEWINTMSGNVAGTALPSALEYGCKACGEYGIGCAVWNFCEDCDEEEIDVPSTAYGTWSIKYNTSASKKYGKGVDRTAILSAYKFPAAVKAYLIEVDAEGTGTTDCDAVKAAKKAYDLAVAESVKVSDAELEKAEHIAWDAQYVAGTNLEAVAEAFNIASNNWDAAVELAGRTYAMQTALTGTDVITASGAEAFRAKTKEVVGLSWMTGTTLITYAGGSQEIDRFTKLATTPITPADLDGLNAKLDAIIKDVADTKAAMDDAGHQLATAKEGKFVADEAAKDAEANWANRAALQAAAKIAVEDAQVKYQALANKYPECL